MLSKTATELLKWFRDNDKWLYEYRLESECSNFDWRDFRALTENDYLLDWVDYNEAPIHDDDGGEIYPKQYRISDAGKALLEENRRRVVDVWITRGLSIAALIISILALLAEIGILNLSPMQTHASPAAPSPSDYTEFVQD